MSPPVPGDSSDGSISERVLRRDEFAALLNDGGYTDVLVLSHDSASDVLTDTRINIIQSLNETGEGTESVSELARRLGRETGAVDADLRRLSELDIVEFDGTGDVVLKHDHVVIDPVV